MIRPIGKTLFLFSLGMASVMSVFASELTPRLLVIEKTPTACRFSFQWPDSQKNENWFSLPDCLSAPEDLVFDVSNHRALVLSNDKYWAVDLKKESKPVFLSNAYEFPSKERLVASKTWFDKTNGRLRVGYLIEVPYDEKDNPDGNWIRKNFPMLGNTWVSKHEDGAGASSIAVVAELGSDNQWKQLATKQTTSQADGALGFGAVAAFMFEKTGVFSLLDLLMRATCSGQDCASQCPKFSKTVSEWVAGNFKAEESDALAVSYVSMGDNDGLLAGVVFGDSYHWVKPLFYCQGDSQNICGIHNAVSVDVGDFDQISISKQSQYVLITKEYEGTSATLFKKGSVKPAENYPSDAVVVWMPADIP